MTLPSGVRELTSVEEVEAAWGDLLTFEEDGVKKVRFEGNERIVIAADAIYVQLRKPVMAGDPPELTTVLRIKEPTVGALRLADKFRGEIEKTACVLESVCCIPATEMSKMGSVDFMLACEALNCFFSA